MFNLSKLKKKLKELKKNLWSLDELLLALEWKMEGKYNFKRSKSDWQKLPFDNVAYMSPGSVLSMEKSNIQKFIKEFEETRYSLDGWRNYKNLWRSTLGLDDTKGKVIFDFGCGFGLESLQFLYQGNEIILGDINEESLEAAQYIINCAGYKVKEKVLLNSENPYFSISNKFDIFYSNGVLHHTPYLTDILSFAIDYFTNIEDLEYRLMLYSDKAWEIETGKKNNRNLPIEKQKGFFKYVRRMDKVGKYADWYDEKKLSSVIPKKLVLQNYYYIGQKSRFSTSIIKLSNLLHSYSELL